MNLIELTNIHKTYFLGGGVEVPVLKGVTLSIPAGGLVSLMGASGSGKSTLMNILGFLDEPTGGAYNLDGRDVTRISPDERADLRNRKIGFVFQNFNLLARTSAIQNVMMPLEYNRERRTEKENRDWAQELLERLGIGNRADHKPSQLSGGQQQRVAIARALVNRPSLLFADEPTGNLDSVTSAEILSMFQKLNEEDGLTIILVTHDPDVCHYAKTTIHIKDGMIVPGAM